MEKEDSKFNGVPCTTCRQTLRYRYRNRCVNCAKIHSKAYRKANPEKASNAGKLYRIKRRLKNPDNCISGCPRPAMEGFSICQLCSIKQKEYYYKKKELAICSNGCGQPRLSDSILCFDCRAAKKAREFKITKEQYVALTAPNVCSVAGCGRSDKLVIDHCHKTGKVRGAICHLCNTALGMVNDDIGRLKGLIAYLQASLDIC